MSEFLHMMFILIVADGFCRIFFDLLCITKDVDQSDQSTEYQSNTTDSHTVSKADSGCVGCVSDRERVDGREHGSDRRSHVNCSDTNHNIIAGCKEYRYKDRVKGNGFFCKTEGSSTGCDNDRDQDDQDIFFALGDFGKCCDRRIECTHIIQDTDTSAKDKYKEDDINGIVNTTDRCKEDFKYALRFLIDFLVGSRNSDRFADTSIKEFI